MTQSRSGRHADTATAGRPSSPRRRRNGRKLLGLVVALGLVGAGLAAVIHLRAGDKPTLAALAANNENVPMLGSSVLDATDLARDTAQFGHLPIVRVYYPGLPPSSAWTTGLAGANKSAVIVSFKALPTAILSGADDAALRHFFATAPTGHPIYYTYFHEPEDNIADGQFTASAFKAAWAHVVALANAAHNPYLHSTLILMQYDLIPAAHRNWKDYLPGGGIISVLGWDAYPVGSATNVHPQLTPPANFMGAAVAASKSVGLPYGFAEFGLSTAAGRPGWLTTVGKYLLSSGALFGSLFNGNQQYPTLRLTDAASVAVWRGYIHDSVSGINAPVSPPSPKPTRSAPALDISGLALSPAALTSAGDGHTAISFTLSHAANVTVCVLDGSAAVVRQITRPHVAAGQVTIPYAADRDGGQRLPAGTFTVLVVASNSHGSATAEAKLAVDAP